MLPSVDMVYTEVMFATHYEGQPLYHELAAMLDRYDLTCFDLFDLGRATNGQLRSCDALFISNRLRERARL